MRYERIRLQGRTFFLRIEREDERWLLGIEVKRDGDEVQRNGADELRHLIEKVAISRRTPMRMNLTYAELEEA